MGLKSRLRIWYKDGTTEEFILDSIDLERINTGILLHHYPTPQEMTMIPYINIEHYEIEPIKENNNEV